MLAVQEGWKGKGTALTVCVCMSVCVYLCIGKCSVERVGLKKRGAALCWR